MHSGMLAAARWLDERLSCIALGLHEAGFRVTVVGHSLGAGAAALLSLMLRNKCAPSSPCSAAHDPVLKLWRGVCGVAPAGSTLHACVSLS